MSFLSAYRYGAAAYAAYRGLSRLQPTGRFQKPGSGQPPNNRPPGDLAPPPAPQTPKTPRPYRKPPGWKPSKEWKQQQDFKLNILGKQRDWFEEYFRKILAEGPFVPIQLHDPAHWNLRTDMGWQLMCDISSAPPEAQRTSNIPGAVACQSSAITPSFVPLGTPMPSDTRQILLGRPNFLGNRWTIDEAWRRPFSPVIPGYVPPNFVPARPRVVAPDFPTTRPWMPPEAIPIGVFLPGARPPPFYSLGWPRPGVVVGNGDIRPRYHAGPRTDVPGPGVTVLPGGALGPPPGGHVRVPPPRGTHERKKPMGMPLKTAQAVFHGLTEGKDFVDSVYAALPPELQTCPAGSLECKVKGLYQHYRKIDMAKAIVNLIQNEVEDRAVGGLLGGAKNATNKALKPYGLSGKPRVGLKTF